MGFIEAIQKGLRQIFVYEGRASRSEYWYFVLFVCLLSVVANFLTNLAINLKISEAGNPQYYRADLAQSIRTLLWLQFTFLTTLGLAQCAAVVRRLHDVGWSGLWMVPNVALSLMLLAGILNNAGLIDDFIELPPTVVLGIVLAGIGSAILCFVISLWPSQDRDNKYGPRQKFREKSSTTSTKIGACDPTSRHDTTASPETPYLDQAENVPEIVANVACDSNDMVKSEIYGTDEIEVENSTTIATRENQHVCVPESIDEANEFLSEDPEVEEKNFPKALKVIEYSAAAAHSWAEVTAIPKVYQTQFLDAIEADPTIDTAKLAWKLIEDHHKQLRPYENEAANDALAQARTIGIEAEKEFIEVYDLIGRLDDADFILQKIEAKFGPSQRTIDAQIKQERELQERERQERERKIEMAAMFERRQRERERQELDQIEKQRIRREDDRRYLQKLREDRRAKASDKIGQAILIGVLVLMAVAILAAVSAA